MNLHDIIAAVATSLTALEGNAVEAFTVQVGHKAKAWESLKPLFTDKSKAFSTVAKNAGKVFTAKLFNEAVAKQAADEGETWEYTDDQVSGLMAFAKHNVKTESGYKAWCNTNGVVAHIDGYTSHLSAIAKGHKTNTGQTTSERQAKLDENKANRLTKLQTARAAIDVSTFYGSGDSLKEKLVKARRIRDAALAEIAALEAQITLEAKASKAASDAAKA